jgi:hypothetical protein
MIPSCISSLIPLTHQFFKLSHQLLISSLSLSQVSAVGAELKHLCLLASSKGVSVALSFNHFDERGTGLVDADQLVSVYIIILFLFLSY